MRPNATLLRVGAGVVVTGISDGAEVVVTVPGPLDGATGAGGSVSLKPLELLCASPDVETFELPVALPLTSLDDALAIALPLSSLAIVD